MLYVVLRAHKLPLRLIYLSHWINNWHCIGYFKEVTLDRYGNDCLRFNQYPKQKLGLISCLPTLMKIFLKLCHVVLEFKEKMLNLIFLTCHSFCGKFDCCQALFAHVPESVSLLRDSAPDETDDTGPVNRLRENVSKVGSHENYQGLNVGGILTPLQIFKKGNNQFLRSFVPKYLLRFEEFTQFLWDTLWINHCFRY